MAYIKYKELTGYFNFSEEMDLGNLPQYVIDYISPGESVVAGYATTDDKFVLTTKKILLFDVRSFGRRKTIHIFPFNSISSSALEFKTNSSAILLSMDSGYQVRLNFVKMDPQDKARFRKFYMVLVNFICR